MVDKEITPTIIIDHGGALSHYFKSEAEVSKFVHYLPAIAAWAVCFPLSLIRDMGTHFHHLIVQILFVFRGSLSLMSHTFNR